MDALVTGATGYLGRPLVARLVAEGATVRAYVRPETAADPRRMRALAHPRVRVCTGELDDGPRLERAARGAGVLFHLAVIYDRRAPLQDLVGPNVHAARQVLTAAACAGIRRVVFSSSVAVYGWPLDPASLPIREDTPARGADPYARSKLAIESLLGQLSARGRADCVSVRLPHIFGRDGTRFEALVRQLLPPGVPVHGPAEPPDPVLRWGRAWQPVHVDDAVAALILAARRPRARNTVIHAAGDAGITRRDLSLFVDDWLARRYGRRHQSGFRPAPVRIYDLSRAAELLGYAPRVDLVSGLGGILETMLAVPIG
jgi:nucleoside-diphosphate-sugar epimerase